MPKQNLDPRLAAVYTHQGDKRAHYDEWAKTYDADLLGDLDYVAHQRCAEIFHARAGDCNARILDLGCGTGLVGAALHALGYARIDGADFSARMLEQAARRGAYQKLFQYDARQPPPHAARYDALISAGLFSFGAPHISDLHNAVRFVARGGVCVLSVNGAAWDEHDLENAARAEAAKHAFRIEEIIECDYIRAQNIGARVLVLRA